MGDQGTTRRGDGPQLIAYADRFGGSVAGLAELLRGPLAGAFDGVHVLPFFTPFDGADAGFDPVDHTQVDPRLGTWDDVAGLARDHTVMADLIVNHVSSSSEAFQDVVRRGRDSRWAPMFLTLEGVFPGGATEADLAAIYRPRPGLPFTAMTLGGERRLVWTTFTAEQVDLDIRSPLAWEYLTEVVDRQTSAGVAMVRLDAVGYVAKAPGTSCFMLPEATEVVARIREHARVRGARVLLEIHGYHRQQVEIARTVDMVYDFALPPLLLHALSAGDLAPLAAWLDIRPTNTVTVLDTHDGIGIIDAGKGPAGEPGLLDEEQIDRLVEGIHERSGGQSRRATGGAASNLDLYQVNCTYYDALGADDDRYLLARLIQVFLPGVPQVYYVGLMAGSNDMELLDRTGVGRDINRHHYTRDEIAADLQRPVVQRQLAALRLRARHPAFAGTATHRVQGSTLTVTWTAGDHRAELVADVAAVTGVVRVTGEGGAVREFAMADLD
ncbi:sucrose phosphorylase [Cellulomonas bogoriensis]|uniref:Sucrose phosphorylase n=1 Tax=Cellulomonas bogoriensis 69B4 = DSM 16987 TaxID=1386082 RepID=A0A0A0C0I0_9CELL|nr:sucrose phosphorylase [Cellulomonas bogoriensis]KGM13681.1 sucrose phosphorylase [Cellulomonas bogoriensis 69B4 = DSM 16987]